MSGAWASSHFCRDVYQDVRISQKAEDIFNLIVSQDNFLHVVRNTPNIPNSRIRWEDFQTLELLDIKLKDYSMYLEKMTDSQREVEKTEILRLISENPDLRQALYSLENPSADYVDGSYRLRMSFMKRLIAILKILPTEFRPKVNKPPYDAKVKDLNRSAEIFVSELEAQFDKIFSTSGYESYAAYEAAVRSSPDIQVQKAIELIDQDRVKFVIRRPESGRFWTPKTGFQNQYVTKSSKGYFGNNERNNLEASMTAKTKEEYHPLSNDLKPKYGTLMVDSPSVVNDNFQSSQYGSDLYVLKKSTIETRVSFFPGDSLNHQSYLRLPWRTMVSSPSHIQNMFIPWSRRLLMIPFMVRSLSEGNFDRPSLSDKDGININWENSRYHNYWEFQVFGLVTLDMVESFHFIGLPPNGEFLQELRKRNIKIFDARNYPAVEWVEGE